MLASERRHGWMWLVLLIQQELCEVAMQIIAIPVSLAERCKCIALIGWRKCQQHDNADVLGKEWWDC